MQLCVVCYQCRQALGASNHQLWADTQEGFTQHRGLPSCGPHWGGGVGGQSNKVTANPATPFVVHSCTIHKLTPLWKEKGMVVATLPSALLQHGAKD